MHLVLDIYPRTFLHNNFSSNETSRKRKVSVRVSAQLPIKPETRKSAPFSIKQFSSMGQQRVVIKIMRKVIINH